MLTPTELKQLCEQYHLRPSKKYGQNYLIQGKPVRDMIAAGELLSTDTVVEVGPGFGVLTLELVKQAEQVYAFEIEQKLQAYWQEQQAAHPNLNIIWGNALHQFPEFSKTLPAGYKVLANLPYQITSNMLRTLLEVAHKPERIVVMVQKEVAERMCAKPGDMSLLAVAVQYYGTPRIVSTVTKGNFFPSPKVDSAIVAITDIMQREGSEQFFRVVRAGFSSKRKQLAKNLSGVLGIDRKQLDEAVRDVTGSATIRAEDMSMDMWFALVPKL